MVSGEPTVSARAVCDDRFTSCTGAPGGLGTVQAHSTTNGAPRSEARRIAIMWYATNFREEARAGIEPANSGFADRCLTTWLPRR
jgi:hypothetical protein